MGGAPEECNGERRRGGASASGNAAAAVCSFRPESAPPTPPLLLEGNLMHRKDDYLMCPRCGLLLRRESAHEHCCSALRGRSEIDREFSNWRERNEYRAKKD